MTPREAAVEAAAFDGTKQCHWCGNSRLGVAGYAGERQCLTCGWGGDGEPDVPCMFYRITRPLPAGPEGV